MFTQLLPVFVSGKHLSEDAQRFFMIVIADLVYNTPFLARRKTKVDVEWLSNSGRNDGFDIAFEILFL